MLSNATRDHGGVSLHQIQLRVRSRAKPFVCPNSCKTRKDIHMTDSKEEVNIEEANKRFNK